MGNLTLKYVEKTTAKGRTYYYFRRGGIRVRLPDPDSPAFAVRYAELMADAPERVAPGYGTMAWLIQQYRLTPEFRNLSPKSRTDREYYLDLIRDKYGRKSARALRRKDVRAIRDGMADTPGKANRYLVTLSVLMEHAIDLDLRESNPCTGLQKLRLGQHLPWPDDVWQRAISKANPMLRAALVTLRYSGQRVSDCCKMSRSLIAAGRVDLVQQKTGKRVNVRLHEVWAAELAKVPAGKATTTLLYNRYGRPLTPDTLRDWWEQLRTEIGAERYVLHGLRKNACIALAEAGCTPHMIAAITGQSLAVVAYYTTLADNSRLADAAITRLEEHGRNNACQTVCQTRIGDDV